MGIGSSFDPFGSKDNMVDRELGSLAYRHVRKAADNIDLMVKISKWLDSGGGFIPGGPPGPAGEPGKDGTPGKDGKDGYVGKDGRGVQTATVNGSGNLVTTMTDGTIIDAGRVVGPAGKDGDNGFGSIVNFSQFTPQPAGGSGVYMIVPVAQGEPGIGLTQSAQVFLPIEKKDAGIGVWIKSTTSGYAITLGLTNAPAPQPDIPGEDLNLSGSGEVFVSPGTIFPLNLAITDTGRTFSINVPSDLSIKRTINVPGPVNYTSDYKYITDETGWKGWRPTGNAVVPIAIMPIAFDASQPVWVDNRLVLRKANYESLASAPIGTDFPVTSDPQTNQVPAGVRMKIRCRLPESGDGVMMQVGLYGTGDLTLRYNWSNEFIVDTNYQGGGNTNYLGNSALVKKGTVQTYEVYWENNLTGPGGFVTVYADGQQINNRIPTESKVAISASSRIYIGSSHGNVSGAYDGMEFESCSVSFTKIEVAKRYETVNTGSISLSDLNSLVVDASGVSAPQDKRDLTYTSNDNQTYTLGVTIGEMIFPQYRAYKAVLEDWSTGTPVAHPKELVMTKQVAQNVRFEDIGLYGAQPAWSEVVPQGECPNINGINYYCEGVRIGTYVQFQFFYDWDATKMPSNPFGNPGSNESYMVPHKWLIYDKDNTLIARVEQPNGQPLNSSSMKPVWEGPYDGVGNAMVTSDNPHFNFGTVRSSVIWRSHDCEPYVASDLQKRVPIFEHRVPFPCFTSYSVNGGDLRIFGDKGQNNGFSNWQIMSYNPTTYDEIQQMAGVAAGKIKYNGLFRSSRGAIANAALMLMYHPFNQMGRSPLTGPGGVRDDRQIMPEPVGRYLLEPEGTHLMSGKPYRKIALDYLTGYASDPYHSLEKGRPTPVFKNNARRAVVLRNHYYGPGDQGTPETSAWYIQSGRVSEWVKGSFPLRVSTANGSAGDSKRPIFGTNAIDDLHAHQYPHWGSLLFKSPEFAMLGHRFMDQARLYDRNILYNQWGPYSVTNRAAAWKYMHAVMAWKTGAVGSGRLYSRAEIMDWIVFDFEMFYDSCYASTPGVLNPPTSLIENGLISEVRCMYAAMARFGLIDASADYALHTHDFMCGYWLSALHAGERMGFNNALRQASDKAKAIVDWLIAAHRKRIVGRIRNPLINSPNTFSTPLWTWDQISQSMGDVTKLPQTFAEVQAAQAIKPPSWDVCYYPGSNGPEWQSRDGQAMDQMIAGPSLLKDMGLKGNDLDEVEAIAESWFQQKLTEEKARPDDQAGTGWFKYHQITNNRPMKFTS